MCQFLKSILESKWSLVAALVMITLGTSMSFQGAFVLFNQYLVSETQNIKNFISTHFPIFDEISTTLHHMSPVYQVKHLFGLDHEEQQINAIPQIEDMTINQLQNFKDFESYYASQPEVYLPGDDLREFTGADRVPATDGWGPYYPILAIVPDPNSKGGKFEFIPGKLCLGPLGNGRAFYVKEGQEIETFKYAKINGEIMAPGTMPSELSAVGQEWNVHNLEEFGNYYVGAAKVYEGTYGIGKVINGKLHHGYGGKEIVTDDFVYIQVNTINNEHPKQFFNSFFKKVAHFEHEKKKNEVVAQDLDKFNDDLQKSGKHLNFDEREFLFKKDKYGKIFDGFGRMIKWWGLRNPMTWDEQANQAAQKGGKLLTNVEAQALLKWAGGPIMKEDAWIPTYRVEADGKKVSKDWIQIGVHMCGVGCSHVDNYGYPEWGDAPGQGWGTTLVAFKINK